MSLGRTDAYQKVLDRARLLNVPQQLDLIAELAAALRQPVVVRPRHSIMELQGLGKELWQDIDAQQYVNQERDTWNG